MFVSTIINNYLKIIVGAFLLFALIFSIVDSTGRKPDYISGTYSPIKISTISTNMKGAEGRIDPDILKSTTDLNLDSSWIGRVEDGSENWIDVKLETRMIVNKISIGFASNRAPVDYVLIGFDGLKKVINQEYKNKGDEWLVYYPPGNISLTEIKIYFNKTSNDDRLQQICEINLLKISLAIN